MKVTDKRIFTPEGDIREEFREQMKPGAAPPPPAPETAAPRPVETKPAEQPKKVESKPAETRQATTPNPDRRAATGDRRRTMADRATNPGTPFTAFLEPLIAQAYMSLGMLPNPYQPQAKLDPNAARQMIDILSLLQEKTAGNLTPEEDEFLKTYLGELKLMYVKITKTLA